MGDRGCKKGVGSRMGVDEGKSHYIYDLHQGLAGWQFSQEPHLDGVASRID